MRRGNFFFTFLFLLFLYIALSDEAKWCGQELGVTRLTGSDNMIPDGKMSASSEDPRHPAWTGRLKDSGWSPSKNDRYPYLQINLRSLYLVCGFKIQGCSNINGGPAWVTRYRVQVSPEKNFWDSWNYIKPEFYGGKSAKEIVYSKAKERKVGQYVRIFPVSFQTKACMKVEVIGEPYISGKVPVFVLEPMAIDSGTMEYKRTKVQKVEGVMVTVKQGTEYDLLQDYAQVIPWHKPLKTELRVDACVLVRKSGNQYMSGRIHEVRDGHYMIEMLKDVTFDPERMKLRAYKIDKLHPVFSAWCKKIDHFARINYLFPKDALCRGHIVRVDSKLVFKAKGQRVMTRISYQKKDRPKGDDFVSGKAVDSSNVIPHHTVLYYENDLGCLLKGTVSIVLKPQRRYKIDGKLILASKVHYYKGYEKHDKCGKKEEYCHDSRIPFRVSRRKCPSLKTWDGKGCKDEDECQTGFASCGLHAACKDTPGFYKCSCRRGFRSNNPRIEVCHDIDECKEGLCDKNADCQNTVGSFSCRCKKGYKGDGKEKCVRIYECKVAANKQKCEKHKNAECVDFLGGYKCQCKEGYHGDDITSCKLANECKLGIHKCHNWATCVDTIKSYECHCKDGFEGDGRTCRDIDECSDPLRNRCSRNDGVECKDTTGSYKCVCAEGYTGNGKECKNIDECKTGSHACVKHSNCIDKPGSYDCKCKMGFDGNGRERCTPISDCIKEIPDCDLPRATCIETEKDIYKCSCKPGYTGDGKRCTDVDECINNDCDKNAECKNTRGSYSCTCKKGFQGNGRSCSDIDECSNGKACGENAYCVNNDGSFWCLCEPGYNGDPFKKCEDVDECKLTSCGFGKNCSNTVGSYVCSCLKGFSSDNDKPSTCKDIDECKTIKYPCGLFHYLSCENKPGTYTCSCKRGWTFNTKSKKCEDINECNQESVCAKKAQCMNSDGSYSCSCRMGYSGDGKYFCDANGAPPSMSNKAVKALYLVFVFLTTAMITDT